MTVFLLIKQTNIEIEILICGIETKGLRGGYYNYHNLGLILHVVLKIVCLMKIFHRLGSIPK